MFSALDIYLRKLYYSIHLIILVDTNKNWDKTGVTFEAEKRNVKKIQILQISDIK